jgi:hypothetical protein
VVAASAGGRGIAEDDANLANDDDEYENDDDADADGWPVRLVAAAAAGKDPTGGRVERVDNADTSIDDEVRRVRESTMVNIMVAAKIMMVDAAPLLPIVIVFSSRRKGAASMGKTQVATPMKKKNPGWAGALYLYRSDSQHYDNTTRVHPQHHQIPMRASSISDRRPRFPWQICLLAVILMWGAINLYLTEMLSRYAFSEPPPPPSSSSVASAAGKRSGKTKTTRHSPVPEEVRSPTVVDYTFDRALAEAALAEHGRDAIFQPLRAFVEGMLNDTVPGTIDSGNLDEKRRKVGVGKPAKFYVPLPLREGSPKDVSGHLILSRVCNFVNL